ncbi:hypothetical protein HELRODRAFT_178692 [Helobdella robusta]|uniref:Uncharacterized protein n=1 Tax=Helobdella robusta TaxID=6412 RepID=T1FDK7_HELRO|nr:hypothetical protein HELRODRAFT_178692 [Helobdella robusta]ESN96892.1 hypothetical protein HELRODRAFT_178692 [Helobdella robusta]
MEENKKRKGDNCGSNMIYWKKWCDRVATTIEIPSTSTVATDHISPSKSVIEAESVSDSKDELYLQIMSDGYVSGSDKQKKKDEKEEALKKMKGSILKYINNDDKPNNDTTEMQWKDYFA